MEIDLILKTLFLHVFHACTELIGLPHRTQKICETKKCCLVSLPDIEKLDNLLIVGLQLIQGRLVTDGENHFFLWQL